MSQQFIDKVSTNSILKRFTFHAAIADAFGLLILKQIFEYTTGASRFFCTDKGYLSVTAWNDFLYQNGFPALAAVSAITVYWLGKGFAKQNLEQLPKLFSANRIPLRVNNYQLIPSPIAIPFMIYFNFLIFSLLVFLCFNPIYFCSWIIVQYIFYLYFNYLQRRGMESALNDPQYYPIRNRHQKFIEKRRLLVKEYLFGHRHTLRESLVVGAAVVGIVLVEWGGSHYINAYRAAYIVVIAAMFINEWIIRRWRLSFNSRFDDVNAEQDREDIRALGEYGKEAD